jgi:hypothetical protein
VPLRGGDGLLPDGLLSVEAEDVGDELWPLGEYSGDGDMLDGVYEGLDGV